MTARLFTVAALLAALFGSLSLVPVASGETTHASRLPAGRMAIGDSVMLGAQSTLRGRGFGVNADESRQVSDGIVALRRIQSGGRLPATVVVHLGTNGTFNATHCRQLHAVVGQHRRLFVMTVKVHRPWVTGNNQAIEHCAARYRNVYLIDWHAYAEARPSLFYSDGYHLAPKGAQRYAALVDRAVDRVVPG